MNVIKVQFKETYMEHPVTRECYGMTREQVISAYGLNEKDIEWYKFIGQITLTDMEIFNLTKASETYAANALITHLSPKKHRQMGYEKGFYDAIGYSLSVVGQTLKRLGVSDEIATETKASIINNFTETKK